MEEALRNHLAVARSKGSDPVLIRRAVHELERWRGTKEVEQFFENYVPASEDLQAPNGTTDHFQSAPSQEEQNVRNWLVSARSGTDYAANAIKKLNEFRDSGFSDVDAFFIWHDKLEKHRVLRSRILALKVRK